MADTKISALTAATTPLAGTEVLPIVQSSTTKQVSVANLTAGRAVSADSLTLTNALTAANGGTGQSSYTIGDILYASGTTALSKLADVATGNALISGGVGVAPSWGKVGLTTHVSGTLAVGNGGTGTATGFTAGSVVFAGASGVYSQSNANFFWDNSNNRLGVGTAAPAQPLHVVGTSRVSQSGASRYRSDWYVAGGVANFNGYDDTGGAYIDFAYSAKSHTFYCGTSANISNAFDASGNLIVATTTASSFSTYTGARQYAYIGSQNIMRDPANTSGRYWQVGPEAAAGAAFVVYNDASTGVYVGYGNTSWTANSDERIKTDLIPIENGANKVCQLRSVTGRYKTDEPGKSRSFLIAQDVQKVLPEAVTVAEDEMQTLGVQYTEVIPLLVAAIKEQQQMIDQLTKRLEVANL